MKIGILSDTHNDLGNAQKALNLFRERGAEQLLHCGDITSPQVIRLFEGWQVGFVFGNMDYLQTELNAAAHETGLDTIREVYTVTLGGAAIAICHGHRAAQLAQLSTSGVYRYVFHGHTHRRRNEVINNTTRVINPGALGGTYRQTRSICVVNLADDLVEFIELDD